MRRDSSATKRIAVFFGGKSCEHDISVITAQQAVDALCREKYSVVPVYMDRQGEFKTADTNTLSSFASGRVRTRGCYLAPASRELTVLGFCKRSVPLHAALVCNHGLGGEDGTLQGYLELANVPFTSCGVMASSTGMDKIIMKKIFRGFNIPCVDFVYGDSDLFAVSASRERIISDAEALCYPLVVKPSNLGSSIGIALARCREELERAIEVALHYDYRFIVEKAVVSLQEINCSVLMRGDEVLTSPLEEPLTWHEVLTFEDKYLTGGKSGMAGLSRRLPAEVSVEQELEIRTLSERIFRVFDCKGVVRIDYLIDRESGRVFANEINTVPGALSYYLWEFGGIAFPDLLDILIDGAIKSHQKKNALTYSYKSAVLPHGLKINK